MKKLKPKYDILWKGVIEEVMRDLLLFVEPEIEKELDLARGFRFLDKELAAIYSQAEQQPNARVLDKLVSVYLRDGTERCVLLHLEVQGKNEKHFSRRMFEYYIRLLSKHNCPIAAIAILTGKDGKKVPSAYEDRCLWMRARYEYKVVRIADYPDEVLKASMNPFAMVMLVAKQTLLKRVGTEEERDTLLLERKELMARLIRRNMARFGKRKTAVILSFLYNYVNFSKPETNRKFVEITNNIFEKKNNMGYWEILADIRMQEVKERAVRYLLSETKLSMAKIAKAMEVRPYFVRKIKKQMSAK